MYLIRPLAINDSASLSWKRSLSSASSPRRNFPPRRDRPGQSARPALSGFHPAASRTAPPTGRRLDTSAGLLSIAGNPRTAVPRRGAALARLARLRPSGPVAARQQPNRWERPFALAG